MCKDCWNVLKGSCSVIQTRFMSLEVVQSQEYMPLSLWCSCLHVTTGKWFKRMYKSLQMQCTVAFVIRSLYLIQYHLKKTHPVVFFLSCCLKWCCGHIVILKNIRVMSTLFVICLIKTEIIYVEPFFTRSHVLHKWKQQTLKATSE